MSHFLENYSQKLYQIINNWDEIKPQMPILITGADETEWDFLLEEIISLIMGKDISNTELRDKTKHPDILILEIAKKTIIDVEKTREFTKELALSNTKLPFKLGFIPLAQKLNIHSQNALLKTLEEPLPNRYIFLGTKSPTELLPTILSRCMFIPLSHNKEELINEYIEKYFNNFSPQQREDIRKWSQGKLGKVRNIGVNYDYWKEISDFWNDFLNSTRKERLKQAEVLSGMKPRKINDTLEFITLNIHESLKKDLLSNDRETLNDLLKLKKSYQISQKIEKVIGANKRSLLEALFMNI